MALTTLGPGDCVKLTLPAGPRAVFHVKHSGTIGTVVLVCTDPRIPTPPHVQRAGS